MMERGESGLFAVDVQNGIRYSEEELRDLLNDTIWFEMARVSRRDATTRFPMAGRFLIAMHAGTRPQGESKRFLHPSCMVQLRVGVALPIGDGKDVSSG